MKTSAFSHTTLPASDQVQIIHIKALQIAQNYKRCEVKLIDILEQAELHKIHYSLGYSSLFKYATQALELSEEVAYIFINVARKTKQVPALKEEIKKGTITVSKAKKITSVLNSTNQKHWLTLAKTATKRELEKQVAQVSPKEVIREKMQYVHPSQEVMDRVKLHKIPVETEVTPKVRVQLQLGVSESLMLRLRRAQDLLSQKLKRPARWEDLLEVMTEMYIEKQDPLKKAQRQKMRGKLPVPTEQVPGLVPDGGPNKSLYVKPHKNRRPLSSALKHQVFLKYQGRCGHQDHKGSRCTERRHLEIHHLQPVSCGGRDELSNLTLLCSGHHRGLHWRQGIEST